MNLFKLDDDLEKCAQYHIDRHVGKMQLEACQLLTTALWVDKYLGFVPRKLEKDELGVINEAKSQEPVIEDRVFTRYLPTHINHPSNIWVRSSFDNFVWTLLYIDALNDECLYRGYKSHSSRAEAFRLSLPSKLPELGETPFALAMPDELKSENVVESYRIFYMLDKAAIPATWRRERPPWWDESIAMGDRRYTDLSLEERRKTGYLE